MLCHVCAEGHYKVCHEVCHDDVSPKFYAFRKVALLCFRHISHLVKFDIFFRDFHGNRVDFNSKDFGSSKEYGCNRQNSGAAAHVQNFRAGLYVFFHEANAKGCGFVSSRAECHSGVDFDNLFSRFCLVFFPGRLYHDCISHFCGLKIFFPVVFPLTVVLHQCGDFKGTEVKVCAELSCLRSYF